ncbi:NHL repeat-containing protein [Candidatus Binatus sp.]|uniref:NHL repeat-containing protein n=2 Tax=Candidatus Binatus sp. TaxID=2811406 RepID=UPI003CAC625D
MNSSFARFAVVAITVAIFTTAFASTADQTADRVLGQIGFTQNTLNFGGPNALNGPSSAAVDGQGNLYVVDQGNNRVLGFAGAASFLNGASATLVIGQPDFYSNRPAYPTITPSSLNQPMAAATDPAGNLYVSDFGDNRVVEYDAPFASGYTAGEPASIIFGNTSSNGNSTGCTNGQPMPTPDNLCDPTGLASDGQGNLFVTDSGYNRVLLYLNPKAPGGGTPGVPGSGGDTTADLVFGQNNSFTRFVTCTTNPQQPTTASSLCIPDGWTGGLALDPAGDLFVADVSNARVLKYDTPLNPDSGEPGAGDTVADLVIGQNGFTSAAQCSKRRRESASVLCEPQGLAVDPIGNLYISDANRVLEFDHLRLKGTQIAQRVYGQKTFSSYLCGLPAANSLCSPLLPAVDGAGRLFVPDWQNNRLLSYDTPLVSTVASRELGQIDFTHGDANFPGPRGFSYPSATIADASGHLYVADQNRVLGWASAQGFVNGQPADLVLGQPDFYSTSCHLLGPPSCSTGTSHCVKRAHPKKPNRSSPLMCSPQGLSADDAGNLFVADTDNNRVMSFANPFDACAGKFPCVGAPPAYIVDGKAASSDCRKPSAHTLCQPEQIALDHGGNLWITDYSNSRVVLVEGLSTPSKTRQPPGTQIIPLNAQLVIGQGPSGAQFNSKLCNLFDPTNPMPSADSLCYPDGVAVDTNGNVYVSDSGNGRLLEYDNPLAMTPGTPGVPGSAGDVTADRAFDAGGSFTLNNCGTTADQLCTPEQLSVDSQNNLYAVDYNRVLEYLNPTAAGGGTPGTPGSPGDTTADVVYGQQGSFTSSVCGGGVYTTIADATTLCQPIGVTVDPGGDVYIADTANYRVLAFTYQSSP